MILQEMIEKIVETENAAAVLVAEALLRCLQEPNFIQKEMCEFLIGVFGAIVLDEEILVYPISWLFSEALKNLAGCNFCIQIGACDHPCTPSRSQLLT